MADTFDEPTRALLDGKNFAVVATLNPDGGPQTSVEDLPAEPDEVVRLIVRVIPAKVTTFAV